MESRVSQLLQQVKNDVDLFLPSKYESLYEMFQHTERVSSFYYHVLVKLLYGFDFSLLLTIKLVQRTGHSQTARCTL